MVEPFMPAVKRLGRPRKVDLRGVVEGLLYILRTACPWRLLPHDFPNRSTVQRSFYAWQTDGLWERIKFVLLPQARERAGPRSQPLGRGDRQPGIGENFGSEVGQAVELAPAIGQTFEEYRDIVIGRLVRIAARTGAEQHDAFDPIAVKFIQRNAKAPQDLTIDCGPGHCTGWAGSNPLEGSHLVIRIWDPSPI
jgi:transposase